MISYLLIDILDTEQVVEIASLLFSVGGGIDAGGAIGQSIFKIF